MSERSRHVRTVLWVILRVKGKRQCAGDKSEKQEIEWSGRRRKVDKETKRGESRAERLDEITVLERWRKRRRREGTLHSRRPNE